MESIRLQKQLEFLKELDKAKDILRNTLLINATRHENDAEHMWHMAIAALVLSEYSAFEGLDSGRVMTLALIHDVIEIDAGDTYAYADYDPAEKEERERKAAHRIFGLLPEDQGAYFKALWEEFEFGDSNEAKFARAMDRVMPLLHNYHTQGAQWKKHGITKSKVLNRNKGVADGSPALWDLILDLLDDSVAKGYLSED